MRLLIRSALSSLLLFTAAPACLHALANNNVRVDRFEWMHVQTEHFDIYYDEETRLLVPRMAHYLERAWLEVGDRLNYKVPGRTPFFFYSGHNKFEQTNIVPIGEGTGGVTEAFKNRFVIYHDGSETWMRHVIYHEFGHVVQFNVLYGGFWKSVRLLKSPFYPLWMMEGMAEYASSDVDEAVGEMVVRDAVVNSMLPPLPELQGFSHLKPNQVTLGYKTGEAAIKFLADEFGPERVGDLLVVMKDHFDISSALEERLGLDLYRFDFRFREWLKERYADYVKTAKQPEAYGPRLTPLDKIPQANEAPVFSPDGKIMYYFSDRGGPTQLYSLDRETGESGPLVGLRWNSYENLHTRGRALSISADGRWLAFAGEKKQRDFLFLYDLEKKRLKRVKIPFEEIRSPVFSPVTDELVCIGMEDGFNDLYRMDRSGHVLSRLTNTPQDERDPVYSRDGRYVYFSGEVLSPDDREPAGRDLYRHDLKEHVTLALTNDPGQETEPEPLPDGGLVYVKETGVGPARGYNLYRLAPDFSTDEKWTQLSGGAFSPRFDPKNQSVAYVAHHAGEKHVYVGTWTVTVPATAESVEGSLAEKPELRNRRSLSLLTGPASAESPLFVGAPAPYRFKASTDLFLPFFLYSSQDGLVFMDVWQASDLLGNHQIQQQLQYASGSDFTDLAVFYTYARFRPQFTIGGRTQKYYRDFEEEDQRREVTGVGLVSYPLDRVSSVVTGFGVTDREDTFLDEDEDDEKISDRYFVAGFQYDTVTGRYLVPTKGRRLDLFFQQGLDAFGGQETYRSGFVEGTQYVPIPGESTIANRIFYARSVGADRQEFRLGGVDRIRAVTSGSLANKKSNVVIASTEARLRIKYLNARTKFLFPDFFFKAAYLVVFDDVGYGWDSAEERDAISGRNLENSAGVGISWPTFILQTFQMNLTVQWAHQTNRGTDVWYISLGPSF